MLSLSQVSLGSTGPLLGESSVLHCRGHSGCPQCPAALPGRALHPSHPTCPRAANSCTRMRAGPLWELGDRHGRSQTLCIPAHLLPAQLVDPGCGWDQESSRHTWRGSRAGWSHAPLASIPGRRAGGQDPCSIPWEFRVHPPLLSPAPLLTHKHPTSSPGRSTEPCP